MRNLYFILILSLTSTANAQFCWEPSDFSRLDGRLKSSDHKVGDVAQIANELAIVSGRPEISVIDFFTAALIKKSPSGRSANNNVIDALLGQLSIKNEFKRELVDHYNQGRGLLEINKGEIVLREEVSREHANKNWNAENVHIDQPMRNLFEKAEQARVKENESNSGNSSFSNNYKGLEHFLVGLMNMKNQPLSTFLAENIGATGVGRLTFGKARQRAKIDTVYNALGRIRGEGGKSGVSTRKAYENYDLGNGKSFYSSATKVEVPHFLNDMVAKMKNGEYGPVHVREKQIVELANGLMGKGKNSVELHSEFDGIGKKHIVLGLAKVLADIKQFGRKSEYYEVLPRELHNLNLYEIDMTAYVSGTKYRGTTEENVTDLKDFAENVGGQTAVVFNNMGNVYELGRTGGSQGLGQQLEQPMSRANNNPEKGIRVIAVTNKTTGNQVSDTGWSRHLERINVREPSKLEVKEIAQTHFERMKRAQPKIEIESLNSLFDYVYDVVTKYPNLGEKLEGVFRVYDKVGTIMRDRQDTRASRRHVLVAASKVLGNTAVQGGEYMPPSLAKSLRELEANLNNSVKERGELVSEIANKLISGMYAEPPVVSGVIRPMARSVTILVGPSGTLKTSIVEAMSKRLGMEFDKIAGAQATDATLRDIAKKVREENPSRIVYISEANMASGTIYKTLENMIDGFGIRDMSSGKNTTFENVHFVLDANVESAQKIARDYGFSETVPSGLIRQLDRLPVRKLEERMKQIKEEGVATYKDRDGNTAEYKVASHPHGVVKFTAEGRRLYNEAVKNSLGGREAFMGRAGEPIAVGYLSRNAYKATVDFAINSQKQKLKETSNNSELYISNEARNYIAELALLPVNIERGARFTKEYLDKVIDNELRKQVRNNPVYRDQEGFFVGRFEVKIDAKSNKQGVEVTVNPLNTVGG